MKYIKWKNNLNINLKIVYLSSEHETKYFSSGEIATSVTTKVWSVNFVV